MSRAYRPDERPPPAVTYRPTWLEVQAVRLLGKDARRVAEGLRQASLTPPSDADRSRLWADARAFYHDAVRRARGRPDCPRELYLAPVPVRLTTTKPENEEKRT